MESTGPQAVATSMVRHKMTAASSPRT